MYFRIKFGVNIYFYTYYTKLTVKKNSCHHLFLSGYSSAMSFSFIGKKILVTGAGQGIGRELTKALSKAGVGVYALGRNKGNIKTLADECDNVHPVIANLNDWKQTKEVVNGLETMDGVVNNAVYYCEESRFTASLNNTKEMLDEAVRVNLLAPINIIQVTANKMIDDGKHGSIVNVSRYLLTFILFCGLFSVL